MSVQLTQSQSHFTQPTQQSITSAAADTDAADRERHVFLEFIMRTLLHPRAHRHQSDSTICTSAQRMTWSLWLSQTSAASSTRSTWRSRGGFSSTGHPSAIFRRPAEQTQTAGRRCSLSPWHRRSVTPVEDQLMVRAPMSPVWQQPAFPAFPFSFRRPQVMVKLPYMPRLQASV